MERYIGIHIRVRDTQRIRRQKVIYVYSLARPPNMPGVKSEKDVKMEVTIKMLATVPVR